MLFLNNFIKKKRLLDFGGKGGFVFKSLAESGVERQMQWSIAHKNGSRFPWLLILTQYKVLALVSPSRFIFQFLKLQTWLLANIYHDVPLFLSPMHIWINVPDSVYCSPLSPQPAAPLGSAFLLEREGAHVLDPGTKRSVWHMT